jgi:hypothetical protein
MPWRRPLLVALMSAAVIGSGHLYCKDYVVGAAYLGVAVILTWSITNISLWALFVLAVLWNYQIFSSYDRAVKFDWDSVFKAEERE